MIRARLAVRTLLVALAAFAPGCGGRSLDPATDAGGAGGMDAGRPAIDARDADASDRAELPNRREPCGNGQIDPGEQCDDGNTVQGDGCALLCQTECHSTCGTCGSPGPCTVQEICGDGVLGRHERCDDGNNRGGDGCASDCKSWEAGWHCPLVGRRCVPTCGDRLITGSETCDDGNASSGDGCSAFCVMESSSARCGDGVVSGAEECDGPATAGDAPIPGGCTSDCRIAGPYCGDGVHNGVEQCDLGARFNTMTYGSHDGCASDCTYPHFCGDAVVDADDGESCDLGPNNGMEGSPCALHCRVLEI